GQSGGVPPPDRAPGGVRPTRYGRVFRRGSPAIFNDVRASMSELEFLADPTAGELRIGTTDPMTAGLLCVIVDRLIRQHPRLTFHVKVGDPLELQDRALPKRDIDLIIGRIP